MRHTLKTLLLAFTLLTSSFAWSGSVSSLLDRDEAPAGVVFEIVGGDIGSLGELLSAVMQDISRLRERFPDLPVVVVTHGFEQFDLLKEHREQNAKAHKLAETMVVSDDVSVHVCGTHAEWYNKTPEDFPDYVNVSAAGPATINDYVSLGYDLIVLP